MNSAGLVAIALIAGVMLVVILGGMAVLGIYLYRIQKMILQTSQANEDLFVRMDSAFDRFVTSVADQFAFHAEESERLDDERADTMKALQSSMGQFRTETRQTLEVHRQAMDEKLTALNAPALQAASVNIQRATREITQAAVLIKELVLDQEERATNDTGMGPEEYAADGRSSVYQSETAFADAKIEREGDTAEAEGPATRLHETQGVLA